MENPLITLSIAAFFLSTLYFVIARIILYSFLAKKGIKVIFGLAGVPGYLEGLYFRTNQTVKSQKMDKLIISIVISLGVIIMSALSLVLL